MNSQNPETKPSGFGDPAAHAAMEAAIEAELDEVSKKVQQIANEIFDFHLALLRRDKLRPQQGAIALIESCAQSMVLSSMMSPDPNDTLKHYVAYLESNINHLVQAAREHPLAPIIKAIYKEAEKCTKESSSAEQPSPSSSSSSESPPSSSSESK